MEKLCWLLQKPFDTVTLMMAVRGVAPVFVVTNAGILPVPLAANPMEVLLLVQLKVEPAAELVKAKGPAVSPTHKLLLAGKVRSGTKFTTKGCVTVVVPQSLVTANVTI